MNVLVVISCLTLKIAAKYEHHGGTRGYRSRNYEETGLFYPIDDYESLLLSGTKAFGPVAPVTEKSLPILADVRHATLNSNETTSVIEAINNLEKLYL